MYVGWDRNRFRSRGRQGGTDCCRARIHLPAVAGWKYHRRSAPAHRARARFGGGEHRKQERGRSGTSTLRFCEGLVIEVAPREAPSAGRERHGACSAPRRREEAPPRSVMNARRVTVFLKSLSPSKAPCGNRTLPAFSGKLLVSGGMLYTTQWTQTILGAFGSGASGSSIIRTRLLAPLGTPSHASGGETSSASQVYLEGM